MRLTPVVITASIRRSKPATLNKPVRFSLSITANMTFLLLVTQAPGHDYFPRPAEKHGREFPQQAPPGRVSAPAGVDGLADEPGDVFGPHCRHVLVRLGRFDHARSDQRK